VPLLDTHRRPLRNLRLSVTDRCNLRCQYCMPEEEYTWLPRGELLHFGEMATLVDAFIQLGVDKVRLTGGEPLLRKELDYLVRMLAERPAIRDIALTTNGLRLAEMATPLQQAGLHRVTVSLDSLQPERFKALTRREGLDRVLAGIAAANDAGFEHTKIDTVVMRGANDDELTDLLAYGREVGAEVRFIEYMDVGGATHWSMAKVVSRDEILARVAERLGPVEPIIATDPDEQRAPADRYRLNDGTTFGIIASVTAPFCGACDRSRLTADGTWYLCLYARAGLDLKTPLRQGASTEGITEMIRAAWAGRTDRGAEQRLALPDRGRSVDRDELRDDPRLEMHTRGG